MVERTVCSTDEETEGNSLKSPNVLPSVPNDGFGILGSPDAEIKRPFQVHPVDLEPDVASTLEGPSEPGRGSGGSAAANTPGRFSLFKWFKRGSRDTATRDRRRRKRSSSPGEDVEEAVVSGSSSTESVDTFYSTATVRSFAFHSGTLRSSDGRRANETGPTSIDLLDHDQRKVGPFGAGAAKLVVKKENRSDTPSDVTRTLPANVLSRRRDLTARYSLQPCTSFGSCGNFTGSQRVLTGSLRRLDERGTGRRVHVRGKRRAPNPPTARPKTGPEETKTPRGSARRKRRPAPKPPERDSLVVEVGKTEPEVVGPGMEAGQTGREEVSANTTIHQESASGSESVVEPKDKVSSPTPVEVPEKVPTREAHGNTEAVDDASGLKSVKGEDVKDLDSRQSVSNDTLVLRGGVWHWRRESAATPPFGQSTREPTLSGQPAKSSVTTGSQTSAMPRPWYKRSVFEHSRDSGTARRGDVLRNPATLDHREEPVVAPPVTSSSPKSSHSDKHHNEGGTLSRLNFFHRSERNSEDRRKENKRKSGLSILTNISELDKEAAAIVQEEQARTRAAMLLQASRINDRERLTDQTSEDVVQDIVTSAMESSPRKGTRALISKFNAIGNITKVTVNTSFFSKSTQVRDQGDEKIETGNSRCRVTDEWRDRSSKFQGSPSSQTRVEKDLSRYFMPQQRSPKSRTTQENREEVKVSGSPKTSRAVGDVSARLSFLQGNAPKANSPGFRRAGETSVESKISRINDELAARMENASGKDGGYGNSPKLSRLRVHVVNSDVTKPTDKGEARDDKKVIKDDAKKRSLEVIQNEFSSIFNEIDRQLGSREFRPVGETKDRVERKSEPGTSSQVSRVLDILVEAEKGDRQKFNRTKPNRDSEVPTGSSDNSEMKGKNEDPVRADLREMLKEMKHSLPKRPKPKKGVSNSQQVDQAAETRAVEEAKKEPEVGLVEEKQPRNSYLMNSVTVVYPPPIRIGPPVASRTNPVVPEEREYDRQKVSSAAQTSGNVRKVSREIGTASSSAKWKNEDVVYKTSGKGVATPGTSGLVKNTFQLIRPREFAEIEAIKTMKGSRVGENTYANVIGQSLYANALVPAPKRVPQGLPAGPSKGEEVRREVKVTAVDDPSRVGGNQSAASAEPNGKIHPNETIFSFFGKKFNFEDPGIH